MTRHSHAETPNHEPGRDNVALCELRDSEPGAVSHPDEGVVVEAGVGCAVEGHGEVDWSCCFASIRHHALGPGRHGRWEVSKDVVDALALLAEEVSTIVGDAEVLEIVAALLPVRPEQRADLGRTFQNMLVTRSGRQQPLSAASVGSCKLPSIGRSSTSWDKVCLLSLLFRRQATVALRLSICAWSASSFSFVMWQVIGLPPLPRCTISCPVSVTILALAGSAARDRPSIAGTRPVCMKQDLFDEEGV
jgi:hypothetical protein